jgi:pyruvate formate lyase activating enzyme
MICPGCFRHCHLDEGQLGFCKGRTCSHGMIVDSNYGKITSMALDPIEKKPLKMFHPGSYILSIGSYGCNLCCPFCQNYEISQRRLDQEATSFTPEEIVAKACHLKDQGRNIGIAFTYNEPMIGYEFVRDTSRLAKEKDLLTVLVTNGCFSLEALAEVKDSIDAMNIDLKGFTPEYFRYIGGDLEMTKAFIQEANKTSHVELTTLVVPHHNDDLEAFEKECQWISSVNPQMPLHITRYFPMYHEDEKMTPVKTLKEFAAIASQYLRFVFIGNV